jgi:hypothetical protein
MGCRLKGCTRPEFVGGLCGFHALQAWSGAKQHPSQEPAARPEPARRRAPAPRPVSG